MKKLLILCLLISSSLLASEITTDLLVGNISTDFKNIDKVLKSFTCKKKMWQAGASVEATLLSPGYKKLDYLKEANRIHESKETIENKFKEIDKEQIKDELCFMTVLEHDSIELATAKAWILRARLDKKEWISLTTDNIDIPHFGMMGNASSWSNIAKFCGKASNWNKTQIIELNVFPPKLVNQGEALLEWKIEKK